MLNKSIVPESVGKPAIEVEQSVSVAAAPVTGDYVPNIPTNLGHNGSHDAGVWSCTTMEVARYTRCLNKELDPNAYFFFRWYVLEPKLPFLESPVTRGIFNKFLLY